MLEQRKTIAESNNFIVLDKYSENCQNKESYQNEADLERELIQDLVNQGYDFLPNINNQETMLNNARQQLQTLNNIQFSKSEWQRFVKEYLDKPSDGILEKTEKIHNNHIYDFTFDDGHIQNIYLLDKNCLARNKVQVIQQFEQTGMHTNRYDVTILVNGLPLLQIELKKRGIAIRQAFNQIHRYSSESFNSEHSLYKYLQLFVISNGTDSRYFSNTTKRHKDGFEFSMNWAKSDNTSIRDLKDFTATFFQKKTLLSVLLHYSVFDVKKTLLTMRPYQIAAAERILQKIKSSYEAKNWCKPEGGGYIWHTTGSGKTLTSFKAARLVTELDFIDKVFFVVDRKDLDYQTMKEYQRFSPDSVNGSNNTAELRLNLEKDDRKIIITTLQKLNNLMRSEDYLTVYSKQVVFIFDECHRSQFGKTQKNLKRKFKRFYQFGFTGTPIFPENALGSETTSSVFGRQLHSYVITDAIRDEKVLKFKVDYNNVRPYFKSFETEQDEKKLSSAEHKAALLHPERIKEISQYILDNFCYKTHRLQRGDQGFNAMFAVSSIAAAKLYYETLNKLQSNSPQPLKIATIFSFAANEEQNAVGEIVDESFDILAMESSAKQFLSAAINDYNSFFKTSFTIDSNGFQNYYSDLAKQVQDRKIDLLIVVGMFLTGFDAQKLNTLFVDKNLRHHGLIQAFSRTNRILNATKNFGNIVCFRNLEQATIEALQLFGKTSTDDFVLQKSYQDYMEGYKDPLTGEVQRGFKKVLAELETRFPSNEHIDKEADKKDFVKLFGEYLRLENMLQNYDEFTSLKALQNIDTSKRKELEEFKLQHHLSDQDLEELQETKVPTERAIQDYRSTYNDIRDWRREQKSSESKEKLTLDWEDLHFEVELLKSQEINLDYILEKIFEGNKKAKDKAALVEDMRRMIRSSMAHRAKESLLLDFIHQSDLDQMSDKASVIADFFSFAKTEQQQEAIKLIQIENLNVEAAKRYLNISLKHGFASENGTELNAILPKMSPLNPQYLDKKQHVFQKISAFVEKFKGVGGQIETSTDPQ